MSKVQYASSVLKDKETMLSLKQDYPRLSAKIERLAKEHERTRSRGIDR